MSQRSARRATLAAVAAALVVSLHPAVATAEDLPRISVDWDRLGVVLHDGASSLLPREPLYPGLKDRTTAALPPRWIGTSPRLSLVARDWGVSQVLWGNLTVTDQFRLSRSSRMVVTRLRLSDGRFTPFTHIAVGQWRVDSTIVPSLPTDVQLAGQLGGGFELEVAPHAVIALETDCTVLYREGHEPQTFSAGQLWGALIAARARF